MKRTVALVALLPLAACAPSQDLREHLLHDAPFTLANVARESTGKTVDRAYAWCPYHDASQAAGLGFDEQDFFSINHNPSAWETNTGIGLIFTDGSSSVEWFEPEEINACGNGIESGTELDPGAELRTHVEKVEYSGSSSGIDQREVRVLER